MERAELLTSLRDEPDPQRRRLVMLAGLPGEEAPRTEVEIEGLRVVIVGVEDLLLDRLRAWVHWKSDEDGRWTRRLALLYSDRLAWEYLRARAADKPEERRALRAIEREVSA